jgi:hypothetical protein
VGLSREKVTHNANSWEGTAERRGGSKRQGISWSKRRRDTTEGDTLQAVELDEFGIMMATRKTGESVTAEGD